MMACIVPNMMCLSDFEPIGTIVQKSITNKQKYIQTQRDRPNRNDRWPLRWFLQIFFHRPKCRHHHTLLTGDVFDVVFV